VAQDTAPCADRVGAGGPVGHRRARAAVNALERAARRVDALQQRHTPLAVAVGVVKKFGDDNGGTLVASLAYAAFVAVFPLLLLLVTVLGIVLSGHASIRASVLHSTFADFPVVGPSLAKNVTGLHRSSIVGLVVGLLGLLWGGTGLAQTAQFTMAQVWNVPGPDRPGFAPRLARSFLFLAVLGSGLVVSTFLAAFGTFGRHDVALGVAGELLAVAVNVAQFLLAFRILTPRSVGTRGLVPGAVAGGVLWTVVLALGGYLVGHDLRNDGAVYGVFGAVLGLVAWVYLGARLSVTCAELNAVLAGRLWPRALVQPPLTAADRLAVALQATENQRRPEQHVVVSFDSDPGAARAGEVGP